MLVFGNCLDKGIGKTIFTLISLVIRIFWRTEAYQSFTSSDPYSFLLVLIDLIDGIGAEPFSLYIMLDQMKIRTIYSHSIAECSDPETPFVILFNGTDEIAVQFAVAGMIVLYHFHFVWIVDVYAFTATYPDTVLIVFAESTDIQIGSAHWGD